MSSASVSAGAVAPQDAGWLETPMEPIGNDRWRATFTTDSVDRYQYAVTGWVDRFSSWERDLRKRIDAGQDVSVDLLIGADLIDAAASRAATEADPDAATRLRAWAKELRSDADLTERAQRAVDSTAGELAARFPDRSLATVSPIYEVTVDRKRAAFSAWYELFPRSTSPDPKRHGTFRDVIARLPYVAGMGFDVLYLPPIHPIGSHVPEGAQQQGRSRARRSGRSVGDRR